MVPCIPTARGPADSVRRRQGGAGAGSDADAQHNLKKEPSIRAHLTGLGDGRRPLDQRRGGSAGWRRRLVLPQMAG